MRNYCFLIAFLLFAGDLAAHPMPGSVVKLSVLNREIRGVAFMPKIELENAIGRPVGNLNTPFFTRYFTSHIRAISGGKPWKTTIDKILVATTQDSTVGSYDEVEVHFLMMPPDSDNLRNFTFDYDVIIHQVVTHSAIVFVEQDWKNGVRDDLTTRPLGVIKLDVPTGKIFPLEVRLGEGSSWKGFMSMVSLGMEHIREGTDHLLFLLTLLLPATLLVKRKRWAGFWGVSHSLRHIVKIVTAFTIGHSITLIIGSTGIVHFPVKPIEILIAVSILVSAAHAFRPLFPGKELFIAAGFGLIHGMAFAESLVSLDLDAGSLALSILGFNLGIELMQLLIIVITIPWLIILSRNRTYKEVRVGGAIFAGIAAVAWIIERVSGSPNSISSALQAISGSAYGLLFFLAILALLSYFKKNSPEAD
ncbi:HupE/UreJ family protein [Hufsiella ginkgonis]|uniref:HupE/UreJ family protein n=1 Tax=Hufsiella ginkgonis TaxID=2695274 RepID=A0A7K1XYB3_9SPHI|nr:HupE/UreJ family protein [Hufsiella ginkgonis]MXV15818.1 HupE/UreJ family protein [Hufsiella ginkgonis]